MRTLPTLVRAEGLHVWDRDGRRYLDATSGAFCAQLGYSRPDLVRAMTEAAAKLPHARPSQFQSEESAEYARVLLEAVAAGSGRVRSPYTRVVLTCSGSEAVDVSLKVAHVYSRAAGGAGRGVRYLPGHYHGATLGALGVTGWKERRGPYEELVGGAGAGTQAGAPPAAIILETIPAAGLGAVVPPPGALARVRAQCDETGALWIADEVLTGFGRVGSLFAWQRLAERSGGDAGAGQGGAGATPDAGALPDVIVFGKGAGAGYAALAGVILTERVAAALGAGGFRHAQTYGGNPIACAVGRRVLEALREERVYERVRAQEGAFEAALRDALGGRPEVRDIRGLGYLWGVEIDTAATGGAAAVAERCRDRGLLVHAATGGSGDGAGSGGDGAGSGGDGATGDAVLIAPPLIADAAAFGEIAAGLRAALEAATTSRPPSGATPRPPIPC